MQVVLDVSCSEVAGTAKRICYTHNQEGTMGVDHYLQSRVLCFCMRHLYAESLNACIDFIIFQVYCEP